jgi:hypothetical protein
MPILSVTVVWPAPFKMVQLLGLQEQQEMKLNLLRQKKSLKHLTLPLLQPSRESQLLY